MTVRDESAKTPGARVGEPAPPHQASSARCVRSDRGGEAFRLRLVQPGLPEWQIGGCSKSAYEL